MIFEDHKPIYLQIVDRICDEILAGKYGVGERVPSVREYAEIVEVNANTVMRSYDYLQQAWNRILCGRGSEEPNTECEKGTIYG